MSYGTFYIQKLIGEGKARKTEIHAEMKKCASCAALDLSHEATSFQLTGVNKAGDF